MSTMLTEQTGIQWLCPPLRQAPIATPARAALGLLLWLCNGASRNKKHDMNTTQETLPETKSHSEQQAWAQLSSICEMVARLSRDGAARYYTEDLDREKCLELIREHDEDEAEEFSAITESSVLTSMRERVAELIENEFISPDDFEFDEEEARQTIQEDPLSVQVRGDWYNPGDKDAGKPSEFEILLCTGGPAVRIRGDLDEHLQPDRAYIEHQDWGTPWTQIFGLDSDQSEALLTYCQQFFFGE